MFQFNRNTELLETIEKQKGQLARYESRLRDLVSAYKSLQNEKQALEASVKALTSSHAASPVLGKKLKSQLGGSRLSVSSHDSSRRSSVDIAKQSSPSVHERTREEDENETSEKDELSDEDNSQNQNEGENKDQSSDDETDAELERLRHQISTLTVSLSTVSEEKSKIVATYQAEKKKLKQETEAQLTELKEEMAALSLKKQELEEELVVSKERIRSQQEDREQEQSTHSIMLRELQKMLNDERTKNEQLSSELQEARKALQTNKSENKRSEDHEKQVKKLFVELETANEKLKTVKEEARKPQPIVKKLQKEIIEVKAAQRIQLEKEHMRYVAAEERLKQVEEEAEDRVASLENQITQLSNQMGGYETSKTRDQILVRTFKERVSQLEAENGILAKQAASASNQTLSDDDPRLTGFGMDVEELKQHIVKYKNLLKNAVQKRGDTVDIDGWVAGLDENNDEDDYQKLYLETQQELRQLRDEFEKYKVRAQNVLKTKRDSGRENLSTIATQQQFQDLKNELEEVRERHFHLRSHCDGLEEKQSKLVKDHGEELMRHHLMHQKELEAEKEIYAAKILELEQEMRSQRERTVALLAEKDKEIQHLQAYSNACHREYQCEYGGMVEPKRQTSAGSEFVFHDSENSGKETATTDSVAEIITQGTVHDTTMIHYAEQMARKDVSINGLRRLKKQLELQIRQLQDVIMMKDEKYSREIAALQERIDSFNRSKSRENANLEYLKNVMYQYLTTDRDKSARNRMLSAVTAILQFSPEETKKVLRKF